VSVTDRLLLKYEKNLPDTEIAEFRITRDLVDNPQKELDQLLTQNAIKTFQRKFLATNGIVITFTPGAIELLKELGKKQKKSLDQLCSDMLRDYEYGLRLLGCDSFTIDETIVKDPKVRLEQLIKEAYEKK
jgi:hypothetical protein